MRIGIGYDIHPYGDPGSLMLGGVRIPHTNRLAGHSDADVLLHAIADALLGAIGAPDLGELFPSSDARHRNKGSRAFVEEAVKRVSKAGFRVVNLDTIIIADAPPKISPQKAKMRAEIGRLLHVPAALVSVKAKTTEGFPPAAGGIAAHAVVLLEPLPTKRAAK